MASITEDIPCLIKLANLLKVLTIGPKISDTIVPINDDDPVLTTLCILVKNNCCETIHM